MAENRPYTLSEVMRMIAAQSVNDLRIENADALRMVQFFPTWESFIGASLTAGFRVQYGGRLYEVRQNIPVVLENQAPSIDTAALYKAVDETHSGGASDPIPYEGNMELESGKYYTQYGVEYRCFRDTGIPVYHDLKDLVGLYVEVVA